MNKVRTPVLGASLLLCAATPAAAQGVAAAAQSVEDVLTRYYEAIGGLESWRALESLRLSGTMNAMGLEAPFTMVAERPGKTRMEFTIQGMTGIQATDGETAWTIMPFLGETEAREMPPEQAAAFKQEADLDGPLVGWAESGHGVELVGTREVAGTETYELAITYADSAVRRYYLDARDYLPVRIEETREVGGDDVTFEQSLGDYREVGGLMIAHTIEVSEAGTPGRSQLLRVSEVELNVPMDDSLFTMPQGGDSTR